IMMGIAFIGAGLGEYLGRRELKVLAEPLQRTGIYLPFIPLLAFWARPPVVLHDFAVRHFPGLRAMLDYLDQIQPNFGKYSILWFLLGLIYAFVARSKRSPRFALFAALASNVGIWAFLYHHQLSFLIHPQLWLIPFALVI